MNFVNGTDRVIVFGGNGKNEVSYVNPGDYKEIDGEVYDTSVVTALKKVNSKVTLIDDKKDEAKASSKTAKKSTKKTTVEETTDTETATFEE